MTAGSNALLMLVAMGIDSPASAIAPTPVTIDYTAPAGCSSLDSFYRGVRSRTDRVRLANPGEPGVQIRVRVLRAGRNVSGELWIGDQQEESETRHVDGISCNEVVEALSLTAALALDPSASLLSERNPRAEPEAPLASSGTPVVAPSASAAPQAPARSSFPDNSAVARPREHSEEDQGADVDLSAQALATTYMSPGLMLGPQVGLRFIVPWHHHTSVTVGLQGFYLSNDLLGAADTGVFQMAGAGLSTCPVYGKLSDWLELGACALARGAWFRARGLGFSHPEVVSRSWWALGVESLASLRIQEHWGFELSAGFATPLIIREFSSGPPSQSRDVGKTPIIGAQMGVGIAYRF